MNGSMIRAEAAFLDEEQPLNLPTLERYWRDPDFAARQDAERAEWQRQTHALIDEGIRKYRQRLNDACQVRETDNA